jgi:hypothetical protein
VPYQVAYPRWSLHFDSPQSVEQASVLMWMDGEPVAATIIHRGVAWPNTLVWEPAIDFGSLDKSRQRFIRVEIRNLKNDLGALENYVYEILLYDPEGESR